MRIYVHICLERIAWNESAECNYVFSLSIRHIPFGGSKSILGQFPGTHRDVPFKKQPSHFDFFSDKMMESLSRMEGGSYEVLYYKKNGRAIWLQVEVTPIRNEQKVVVLFLCSFRDITAFKVRERSSRKD